MTMKAITCSKWIQLFQSYLFIQVIYNYTLYSKLKFIYSIYIVLGLIYEEKKTQNDQLKTIRSRPYSILRGAKKSNEPSLPKSSILHSTVQNGLAVKSVKLPRGSRQTLNKNNWVYFW